MLFKKKNKQLCTYLIPVGNSLGDNIVFSSFQKIYKKEHPDEKIILCDTPFDDYKNAKKIVLNLDGAVINPKRIYNSSNPEIFTYDLYFCVYSYMLNHQSFDVEASDYLVMITINVLI